MGRPINNRFINTPSTGIGGEGVDTTSAKVHGGNSYSSGTTVTFANPLAGGTTAVATVSLVAAADTAPGNGNVSGVTVTTAGSGYVEAPVVTFVAPANVVVDGFTQIAGKVFKFSSGVTEGVYPGMVANVFFTTLTKGNPTRVVSVDEASGNITMSTANTAAISSPVNFGDVGRLGNITVGIDAAVTTGNTIQVKANIGSTGSSIERSGDIVAQVSSNRYRVITSDGTAVCQLVSNSGAQWSTELKGGQMTIGLTDSDSGTYLASKLNNRTVIIGASNGSGGDGTQFVNGNTAKWTLNTAVASTTLKINANE